MKSAGFNLWVVLCLVNLVVIPDVAIAEYARNYNYITWDDLEVVKNVDQQTSKVRLELRDERNGSKIIVVDKNGRGDSVTVQGAVDMVPPNNAHRVKIYILPGIYRFVVYYGSSLSF